MSILLSVVSHKQADLVLGLLNDIERFCLYKELEVVVTINIFEKVPFKENDFNFRIRVIQNEHPKGFGANHNTAFKLSNSEFFCIINPDVHLIQDPMVLISSLKADRKIGVVGPLIINEDHSIEDSARRLPTPLRLLKRYLGPKKDEKLDYNMNEMFYPDWVAGIFMLFSSKAFAAMKGFDERYHLYFEDVDLCSRLRLAGYRVVFDPRVSVVHNARRASHKNIHFFRWHILSGCRFFSSRVFWQSLFHRSNKTVQKALWS
jgi:N-acetylglucosaminyl-diphospho-decaprenol L-rhamnosyltransferase